MANAGRLGALLVLCAVAGAATACGGDAGDAAAGEPRAGYEPSPGNLVNMS